MPQHAESDSITGKVHQIPDVTVSVRKTPQAVKATSPLQVMGKMEMERLGVHEVAGCGASFLRSDSERLWRYRRIEDYFGSQFGNPAQGVIYDGVAVSDCQSGQVDISRFSLDNISQLTMTIGQSDDIYQTARAFASAGVLTIQTSRPDFQETSYHVNANLKAEPFGLVNPSVLYNQKVTDNTSFYRFMVIFACRW